MVTIKEMVRKYARGTEFEIAMDVCKEIAVDLGELKAIHSKNVERNKIEVPEISEKILKKFYSIKSKILLQLSRPWVIKFDHQAFQASPFDLQGVLLEGDINKDVIICTVFFVKPLSSVRQELFTYPIQFARNRNPPDMTTALEHLKSFLKFMDVDIGQQDIRGHEGFYYDAPEKQVLGWPQFIDSFSGGLMADFLEYYNEKS